MVFFCFLFAQRACLKRDRKKTYTFSFSFFLSGLAFIRHSYLGWQVDAGWAGLRGLYMVIKMVILRERILHALLEEHVRKICWFLLLEELFTHIWELP